MSIKEHPPQLHVPVLLDATLDALHPIESESYLDLTAGYGGHASAILARTANYSDATLVDRDAYAIGKLETFANQGAELLNLDFVSAAKTLIEQERQFDIVLADLGVSSPQLDQEQRGFSFRFDAPLDMRMDQSQEIDARFVVNTYEASQLATIIAAYGEEPYAQAKKIAEAIVRARPIETTQQLADVVAKTIRGRKKRIHPATRTFQAIRIEVNAELAQVEALLPLLPKLLKTGGRVGVISFHSLEDRLVKTYFASELRAGYEAELLPEKKPIHGNIEDVHNPRSRSAKLRVAVKK